MENLWALRREKQSKMAEIHQKDFRIRQRGRANEQRAEADLHKSQKVCEQLDSKKVCNKERAPMLFNCQTLFL